MNLSLLPDIAKNVGQTGVSSLGGGTQSRRWKNLNQPLQGQTGG